MADFYCDHGIYAAPVAAGTVPTAAEDGNGKAKTAATMATLVLDFTGQPTADQSVTIAGVTFTAKASGATGNQFNIGATATDTATNLKTAINASTTNAVSPTMNTCPLRNAVNATSSAAVVTVYTRICGSEWNSVTETSTLSNVTVTQWSGGADGAWGYFFNEATIAWPTTYAARTYGVVRTVYLGRLSLGGDVAVRSGKTLTIPANSGLSIDMLAVGSAAKPLVYVFDDGTEWAGTDPIFTITQAWSGNNASSSFSTSTAYCVFKGKRYSSGVANFKFDITGYNASPSIPIFYIYASGGGVFDSVDFIHSSATGGSIVANGAGVSSSVRAGMFINCLFRQQNEKSHSIVGFGGNFYYRLTFIGCVFQCVAPSAPQTSGLVISASGQGTYTELIGCTFKGFLTGTRLAAVVQASHAIYFNNCDFGNVNDFGPYNLQRGAGANYGYNSTGVSGFSQKHPYAFFMDTGHGFCCWNPSGSYPTLNARLLDGTTPWSMRIKPPVSAALTPSVPFLTPDFIKRNTLGAGVRTITANFLLDTTLTFDKSDFMLMVSYTDTSGDLHSETSGYVGAFTATTEAWSATTWGGVSFDKKSIALTTAHSVAADSDIVCCFAICVNIADTTKEIFADPEVTMT